MSQENEAFAEIEKYREQIDAIDKQLVRLLNERAGHSLIFVLLNPMLIWVCMTQSVRKKSSAKLSSYNEGPLYNENLVEIYRGILKVMKEVPSRD